MAKISRRTIDEIYASMKIEEVVGDFVSLKRQGSGYVGICPFHDDRNPSMHVTPRLGIYKCFVCDAKGNAINFLMEHEKITYPEALEYLAKKYSITIEYDRPETDVEREQRTERESLYLVNEFAEKFFIDQLHNTEEGQLMGMTYFKERGFKDSTIEQFHLGYCPDSWDTFTKEALKQGYQEDFLLKLGLTHKSSNGKLYDFYRGRVIFPIHNVSGKVIGFGGRVLKKDEKTAKYYNSPENEIYHKRETLYDIYLAKKAIRAADNIYLVEGYTDVISMFESGIENVVASSGTSLTEEQIHILSRQSKNITVLYDGDRAGIKASLRGIDLLLNKGMNVKVCLLPDGDDPDSFAKKHRDSEMKEYLEKNTTDFLLFKAQILSEESGNDPVKRAAMVSDMLKSIAGIQDNIVRAFYVKECSRLFNLPEETLNTELKRLVWANMRSAKPSSTTAPVSDSPAQNPFPEINIHSPKQTQTINDKLYEAEKNLVILLLQFGCYEIHVEKDEENLPIRVDQFICDELFNDNIILKSPVIARTFDSYVKSAELLKDQNAIQRALLMSEDDEVRNFVIENLPTEIPEVSPNWENRYEVLISSMHNNVQVLQQEVQNVLMNLKLRVVEDTISYVESQLKLPDLNETDTEMLMGYMCELVQTRKTISSFLNRTVS
ncbi:MAG: DNA primase [Bacteroidales bacterium]|nr:DNA primase [Bacteroidales bacterium]